MEDDATLDRLGFDAGWAAALAALADPTLQAGRVVSAHQKQTRVALAGGEVLARVAGRLRLAARSGAPLPVTGDWVAVRVDPAGSATIEAVLPRRSSLSRKAAGEGSEAQVLVANVDTVLLVSGLDLDFNLRRIERYLVLGREAALDGRVAPVVVLNKVDACAEADQRLAAVRAVAAGVPVVAVSARTGQGIDGLAPWLGPGRTVVLLGSSGVGKSSLLNALAGEDRIRTAEVRAHDGRGKHTTTRRELLRLPSGAIAIDTPGLREILPRASEEAIEGTFPEVGELADGCRFRDCRHDGEPGCAVAAAVAAGELPAGRLESYRKLRGEARHLAAAEDQRLRSAEKRKWRVISKAARKHKPRE